MQNNSPLWLQLVSISAINIHIHTNIHQFSFIHYILFLAIQSLCTPLCLTAAGWRRYNLWLAGKSADFRTWTPAFLSNFPWKTTWILWNLLYFFLCPSHAHWGGGSAALDHMLHSARSRKCGKKKGANIHHKSAEMQENCDSGGESVRGQWQTGELWENQEGW